MALPLLPIEIIQHILNIENGMKYKLVLDELKSRNVQKITKMLEYAKEFDLEETFIEQIPIIGYIGDFSSLFRTLVDGLGADYSSIGDIQNEFQSIQNGLEAFLSLSLPEREDLKICASCNVLERCYISNRIFTFYMDNNRKTFNGFDEYYDDNDYFSTKNEVYLDISVFICSKEHLKDKLIKLWVNWIVFYIT